MIDIKKKENNYMSLRIFLAIILLSYPIYSIYPVLKYAFVDEEICYKIDNDKEYADSGVNSHGVQYYNLMAKVHKPNGVYWESVSRPSFNAGAECHIKTPSESMNLITWSFGGFDIIILAVVLLVLIISIIKFIFTGKIKWE